MAQLDLKQTASPVTPSSGYDSLYFDANGHPRYFDSASIDHRMSPKLVLNTTTSGSINTTETIILGGSSTPILANTLKINDCIRGTLNGSCIATVQNTSTFKLKLGTTGTLSDANILTFSISSASGGVGTSIQFKLTFDLYVLTVGAAATAFAPRATLLSADFTVPKTSGPWPISDEGIATQPLVLLNPTVTAFNSTVNNFLTMSYVTGGTTTTSIFNFGLLELI